MTTTFAMPYDWLDAAAPSAIVQRFRKLEDLAAVDADKAALTFEADQRGRDALDVARTNRLRAEEAHADGAATEADVARMRAEERRVLGRTNDGLAESGTIVQRSHDSTVVLDGVKRLLAGMRPPAPKASIEVEQTSEKGPAYFGRPRPKEPTPQPAAFEIITPDLPDGDPIAIIAAQREEIARLHAEIEDVQAAPVPLEAAKRAVRQQVADLANRGRPTVPGAGEAGAKLNVTPPLLDIGAEPSRRGSGATPRVADTLAMLCWAMPDAVLAALDEDLAASYAGIETAYEPHEAARAVRDLKRSILAAERVEAEAVWQALAAGHDVRFRPDANPRAVLGLA